MMLRFPLSKLLAFGVLLMTFTACQHFFPAAPDSAEVLAEPLEGLTPEQLSLHISGDEAFAKIFTAQEGLGPIFVNSSCEGCHIGDGKGHPFSTLTRFGRMDTGWSPLSEAGGPQLQHRAIAGFTAERIPEQATGITRLLPPLVTGLGYVEALDDQTLIDLADPNDADGDGISGRLALVDPPAFFKPGLRHQAMPGGQYIGRFGRKAAAITLLQQTAMAYREDMGITSELVPEDLVNVQIAQGVSDAVPEPEVAQPIVEHTAFYIATLKAPPRRNAADPNVIRGEQKFEEIGCAKCHVPTLTTGSEAIEPLRNKTFHPYSDFLLHDMGSELDDGYQEGGATSAEWRTTPLWGLGLSEDSQGGELFLMHDGRAKSFEEAIQLHGGEAAASRTAYLNLSQADKDALLNFMRSL